MDTLVAYRTLPPMMLIGVGDPMSEKMVIHNIIGGEIQPASDGQMMDIVNPSTGEVYASAPNSSAKDVDDACQAAAKAFEKGWSLNKPVVVPGDDGDANVATKTRPHYTDLARQNNTTGTVRLAFERGANGETGLKI